MKTNDMHATQDVKHACPTCLSNPDFLIIDRKNTSRIVAGMLLGSFFIFVSGYFFGKKKLAEDFSSTLEHTNFSDQMSYALTTLQDHNNAAVVPTIEAPKEVAKPSVQVQQKTPIKYAAQLLGGTQKSVTDFAERMAKKGILIEVRKRTSKTARGTTMHWYQAVTQAYADENELKALIDKIKKFEKIGTIQIVQIST